MRVVLEESTEPSSWKTPDQIGYGPGDGNEHGGKLPQMLQSKKSEEHKRKECESKGIEYVPEFAEDEEVLA